MDTRHPEKNFTPVHEETRCILPTLSDISMRWVAIQQPVMNFKMLPFIELKYCQGYTIFNTFCII